MRKLLLLLIAAPGVAGMMTGCSLFDPGVTTVCEFAADGTLTRKTTTTTPVLDKLIESTRSKTIVAWNDGWMAYISASTATTDDPTPTMKLYAGRANEGYMSVLENQSNLGGIAEVVAALKGSLSITSEGITQSSGATGTATTE